MAAMTAMTKKAYPRPESSPTSASNKSYRVTLLGPRL